MPTAARKVSSERNTRKRRAIPHVVAMMTLASVLLALVTLSFSKTKDIKKMKNTLLSRDYGGEGMGANVRSSTREYYKKILGRSGRVAVYITGQAWSLGRTICSLRQNIFAPLVQQG